MTISENEGLISFEDIAQKWSVKISYSVNDIAKQLIDFPSLGF